MRGLKLKSEEEVEAQIRRLKINNSHYGEKHERNLAIKILEWVLRDEIEKAPLIKN